MLFWHGVPLGVDFRGGTLVYVKFSHPPDDNAIREALRRVGLTQAKIQRLNDVANNEVLIDLDVRETSEKALDQGKVQIINALETNAPAGKLDLNNTSSLTLANYLLGKDPLHAGTDAGQRYTAAAKAIVDYRDKTRGGVLSSFDELKTVADPAVVAGLQDGFFLSDFGVYQVEIVGPQVGEQLKGQAMRAVAYSLAGMLIYLGFRFEWIYGVAAVITVFHDTLITVGAFSLANNYSTLTLLPAVNPGNTGMEVAFGINDVGQIAGFGMVTTGASAGEVHGFLATPGDSEDDRESSVGAPGGTRESEQVTLPERARFGRFRPQLVNPR